MYKNLYDALPQGGYRPDVYCVQNIIGYTGSLHRNPTVYFLSDNHYGHITQDHGERWNIGRQLVESRYPSAGFHYEIINDENNGLLVASEYAVADDGSFKVRSHQCRGEFISTKRAGLKTYAILAQAIWRFPHLKAEEPRGMRRA